MRLRNRLLLLAALPASAGTILSYHVMGDDPGGWPALLGSIGLVKDAGAGAGIVVAPQGANAPFAEWSDRVEHGAILVLEGQSPLAAAFGFRASSKPHFIARSVVDVHDPKLRIVWEKPLDLAQVDVPSGARVFATERWTHAPLAAGFRRGQGAVLWIAAPPGPHGYERFPYIPQALADLGFEAPFHSRRLWAFFDSSYRARIDPDYFAPRWRSAGIGALHIAAWHYWEPDPQGDQYLRTLIEACHRNAIQVYAWLELPHVSEKFWADHLEWREKTALLQDAQLDWRKLMNLANRDAFAAVSADLQALLRRFDWDGVNLAELYFESLEGYENPARFTPMNHDIRAAFRQTAGFDPVELFDASSPHSLAKDAAGMAKFLEFRADLARARQAEWIGEIETARKTTPQLDLVLTHVDDRFDTSIRDKIGADASRLLPMLASHDFTFLVEDPATIWNLGPQRYPQIAARYNALTPARSRLAIDINIVERYQDVYPTKQQTGAELFELVHTASASFLRVALYFENSIARLNWPLLASAASNVTRVERGASRLVIDSLNGAGVPWTGPAAVDGKPWPAADGSTVWLPSGVHAITPAQSQPALHLLDLNGDLKSASAADGSIEFAYQSSARAMARLDRVPGRIEIDGVEANLRMSGDILILPRGQHLVTLTAGSKKESAP